MDRRHYVVIAILAAMIGIPLIMFLVFPDGFGDLNITVKNLTGSTVDVDISIVSQGDGDEDDINGSFSMNAATQKSTPYDLPEGDYMITLTVDGTRSKDEAVTIGTMSSLRVFSIMGDRIDVVDFRIGD